MTRTMVGFEDMKKSILTISVVAALAFAAGYAVSAQSAKVQPPEALVQAYAGINARLNSDLANGLPVSWVAPPETAHQVVNTDSFPFHFYRIEFKRIEGTEIMKKKSYP